MAKVRSRADVNIYEGIDFANKEDNIGRCYLVDDGRTLRLRPDASKIEHVKRVAVDCPFGTSFGFQQLLSGNRPADAGGDGFKTRETERWLRTHVRNYAINQRWLGRSELEREEFPRASFFNGGSHVQPTLGLQIVPACVAWLMEQLLPDGDPTDRYRALCAARKGESSIVEAHPRPFLYSVIERLWHTQPGLLTLAMLDAVASYKDSRGKPPHTRQRAEIYRLLPASSRINAGGKQPS